MMKNKKNQLDHFLASVEKRAFQMTRLATGDADEALDIVQDSMLYLAKKYPNIMKQNGGLFFIGYCKTKSRTGIGRKRPSADGESG
jgi:RNA polymerase sigma-70 factor (ECF subfamily)